MSLHHPVHIFSQDPTGHIPTDPTILIRFSSRKIHRGRFYSHRTHSHRTPQFEYTYSHRIPQDIFSQPPQFWYDFHRGRFIEKNSTLPEDIPTGPHNFWYDFIAEDSDQISDNDFVFWYKNYIYCNEPPKMIWKFTKKILQGLRVFVALSDSALLLLCSAKSTHLRVWQICKAHFECVIILETYCNNTLQHTATHCNLNSTPQHVMTTHVSTTPTHVRRLPHCNNTLQQHTATSHCNNTLQQHTATSHCNNTQQNHTATTHCIITLQHSATHWGLNPKP